MTDFLQSAWVIFQIVSTIVGAIFIIVGTLYLAYLAVRAIVKGDSWLNR
jgi:hypothetical protein